MLMGSRLGPLPVLKWMPREEALLANVFGSVMEFLPDLDGN
jgi:hypothetical protein